MLAAGGYAAAAAAGLGPGTAAAVGATTEVVGTAASIAAAREYGPSVMNAAHNAFGGNHVGVTHLSDAAEMNVAHHPGRHTMPNDTDYSVSAFGDGIAQNQEHAARIAAHKRKDAEEGGVQQFSEDHFTKRYKRSEEEVHGDPDQEPEDPMIQAMVVGPQLNTYLNSQGSDRNSCWVEAESVVLSTNQGKVAIRLPLSMGGLRYNQPFATFAGMYYAFRPRVFEFSFSPIKYDATYQTGAAPKVANETVLDVVNGAIQGTQQVPTTQTQQLNDNDWITQDYAGAIPRVGPVAVAIVPRVALDTELETAMSDANMSVADVRDTTYSKVWDCVAGELPTMRCKYTVPITDADDAEFVDPFPLSKYRTELGASATDEQAQAHDKTWKLYGKLYACCDKIQKNTECYLVKTRVLVEFRGLRDTYVDPPTPVADIGGVIRQGDRRLVEDHRNPSNSAKEGYANNTNVVTSNTSTDMTQVNTNASQISTHNQRITALETLATNLKTHAGTASYDMHIADSAHTLHGRIMTNTDTLGTGVDLLYPSTTSGGITIQPNVPTVSEQVVTNANNIASNYQAILANEQQFSLPNSILNTSLSQKASDIATLQGGVSALNTGPTWTSATISSPYSGYIKFLKEGNGRVTCRARLVVGTWDVQDKRVKTICTIPSGYRPANYWNFVAALDKERQNVNAAGDLITGGWNYSVHTNGNLQLVEETGPWSHATGAFHFAVYIEQSWWTH